jgi:hypothetical protein
MERNLYISAIVLLCYGKIDVLYKKSYDANIGYDIGGKDMRQLPDLSWNSIVPIQKLLKMSTLSE